MSAVLFSVSGAKDRPIPAAAAINITDKMFPEIKGCKMLFGMIERRCW